MPSGSTSKASARPGSDVDDRAPPAARPPSTGGEQAATRRANSTPAVTSVTASRRFGRRRNSGMSSAPTNGTSSASASRRPAGSAAHRSPPSRPAGGLAGDAGRPVGVEAEIDRRQRPARGSAAAWRAADRSPRRSAATARATRRPRARGRHRPARSASSPRCSEPRATSPASSAPTTRYHFEMKPAVPGVPTRPKPAIVKAAMVSGILRPMPASSPSCTVCGPIEDGADRQEERRLHQRVIDDVDEPAGQAGLVGEPDAERDVADLRDRRIGEHPLQVASRTPRSARRRTSRRATARRSPRRPAAPDSRWRRRRSRRRSAPGGRSRPWSPWPTGRRSPRTARRRRRSAARHGAGTARASG